MISLEVLSQEALERIPILNFVSITPILRLLRPNIRKVQAGRGQQSIMRNDFKVAYEERSVEHPPYQFTFQLQIYAHAL